MTQLKSVDVISTHEYTSQKWYDLPIEQLQTFDNTKLVAINTCPLWGIVRYTHHKCMSSPKRAMSLEAGAAAHEVFAAHRLYSFREFGATFYESEQERIDSAFVETGRRIFGERRFQEMSNAVDEREDYRTRNQQFSLTALYNCEFRDDPEDRRRTTTNIEEMCIAYMDTYERESKSSLPYWNGKNLIGTEIPVDVVIRLTYEDTHIIIRFMGKADGLHYTDSNCKELRVHENKTASRLGDAWEMSWDTNHQPTGYMIALSALLKKRIRQCEILGTCLPLPKTYAINGFSRVVIHRKDWQIAEWFRWLFHTVMLHEQHKDNPTYAPMYTHSCNRYFRPCSFIPLCATEPDERRIMFEDMHVQEWSPLHAYAHAHAHIKTEGTQHDLGTGIRD